MMLTLMFDLPTCHFTGTMLRPLRRLYISI